MTFWEHFFRLLPRSPKPALAALYWHVTRRKVRARNRLMGASADKPFAYELWIRRFERNRELTPQFRNAIDGWMWRPRFAVVVHRLRGTTPEQVRRSINSIEQQIYPSWTRLETEIEPKVEAEFAAADYIVPLRAGDTLSEAALYRFAEALQPRRHKTAIIYGDEDRLDRWGRRTRPWFKPRWNEELFFAQDYLSGAVAIESGLMRDVITEKRPANLSELLLATTSAATGAIVGVPHVLCHVDSQRPADPEASRVDLVFRHLQPRGAVCSSGPFGTVKVEWPLPDELPLVSLVIPTKDKLELLKPCLESVLARTDYDNFELIIVDNGSVEVQAVEYLKEVAEKPGIRVLSYPHRYNFSAINNFAARHARGKFLCLLNNDTEVLQSSWLLELMRYAVQPECGAVGAKLLYEDGSIQHAGVVVGIGEAAGHAHRFLPDQQPGYFRMAHVAQSVSAVTAACLVVEKEKYLSVGGLDEEKLAVAFNDVDLCLKLQAAGWRNVYTPHAVLLHHESKSRGNDFSPTQVDRYRRELEVLQDRWGTKTYDDPLHNPNLDRYSETFTFRL